MSSAQCAHGRITRAVPAIVISALLLAATPLWAEEDGTRAGHGYVSVSYQYISADGFEASNGFVPSGPVDSHSLLLEMDYHLTERWTISAGVPYISKRYQGTYEHDPLTLDPPRPWIENVDQGDWNSDFQDFRFGLRYLAKDGPLVIEPFAYYGMPTNNYPFFGHAAVGQRLWRFGIGTSFTYFPGLSNAYYRTDIAYVFVEETLGTSINHWKIFGEAGYQFNKRWTGSIFFLLKDGKGLDFPDDFPPPLTTELWYQHDRLLRHNYLNVGIGLDLNLDNGYQFSANFMKQPWQEQSHKMEYAFSIGVSRGF